jgi:hypothetical protein
VPSGLKLLVQFIQIGSKDGALSHGGV